MSQLSDTNYVNKIPVAVDYAPWVQDSDADTFTATMQQFADLFFSLAGKNLNVSVVSSNTVLGVQQLLVMNSGSAQNVTLPASSLNTGRGFLIANKGSGVVTILASGSDTIGGAASIMLAQYETAQLYSDGIGMYFRF